MGQKGHAVHTSSEPEPNPRPSGSSLSSRLRSHLARAALPAVALVVVAGGTASAVTLVALAGSEVDAVVVTPPEDAAREAEDDALDDGSTDEPDDPTGGPGTVETTDASPSEHDEDSATPVPLTFEEAVAAYGPPDYAAILTRRFPGAQWSLNGSSYAGLEWLDATLRPTQAALDALWPDVAQELAAERAAEQAAEAARTAEQAALLEARRNDPDVQALVDSFDPRTIWGSNPDYAHILTRRFPGAQWSLNGNDPDGGLTWHGDGPGPTKAELDALWEEVAREMALEMDPKDLARWAGTGEQIIVDGVLRPKGWVGGADDPQPEPVANPDNLQYLPQIPPTNNGSPVGSLEILKDPTGAQNFEQKYGLQLHELGARIAEAHGYFGGSSGLGLGLNGDRELMWYSDQVDPEIVEQVLRDLGALPTEPPVAPPAEAAAEPHTEETTTVDEPAVEASAVEEPGGEVEPAEKAEDAPSDDPEE